MYRYSFDDFLADKWPQGHPRYVEISENGLTILRLDHVWVSNLKWTFWSIFRLFPEADPPALWIKPYGHYDERSYLLPQRFFHERFRIFQDFEEEYARLEKNRAHYLYANMQDSVSPRSSRAFARPEVKRLAFRSKA